MLVIVGMPNAKPVTVGLSVSAVLIVAVSILLNMHEQPERD